MDTGLKGKGVIIMGGSSGIGLESAKIVLQEGATVALGGRNTEQLHQAESYLKKDVQPGHLYTAICDVTDKHQVNDLVANVKTEFNKITVLVNSAGYSIMGHFLD